MNEFVEDAYDGGLPRNQIREILEGVIPEDAAWAPNAEAMLDLAMANLVAQAEEPQEPGARGRLGPSRPGGSPLSPAPWTALPS